MSENMRMIKLTLEPFRRGRVEMIRALMTMKNDGKISPTWNDVFAFLIDIAPVDEWMCDALNAAKQPQPEEVSDTNAIADQPQEQEQEKHLPEQSPTKDKTNEAETNVPVKLSRKRGRSRADHAGR